MRKLRQCSVVFDFNDASQELKGKQIKAQTLHEMLDYITSQRGVITEQIYPEVVSMVSVHFFQGLDESRAEHKALLLVLVEPFPVHSASSQSHWRRL